MAQLLIERKDAVFGDEGLTPDEEIRLRNDLGRLTIDFIKSFLQTSVYLTDHQLTHKAIDQFFNSLEPLKEFFYELTFVASQDETKPDFTIEGVMVEPIPLTGCIKTVLAEEFLGKLQDFFRWNMMVSMSFRREMDKPEMIQFLKVTARKFDQGEPGEEKVSRLRAERRRKLSSVMIESNFMNISVVSRDDVLFIERTLPWRVKLALTRLMKNLRDVPLYAKASKKEIQEAKTLLLQEIIRPLRGHDLLMEFLLNCDIVETADTEMEGMDVEADIMMVLQHDQLAQVSSRFLDDLKGNPGASAAERERKDKCLVLLRKCLLPLSDVLNDKSLSIFREAVKAKLLSIEELPNNVQEFLRIEKLADAFLNEPEKYLQRIKSITSADAFRAYASNSSMLFRELVYRKEFIWAVATVKAIHHLCITGTDPRIKYLAQQNLDAMTVKRNFERMISALSEVEKEQQEHVFAICRHFQEKAVPHLIQELRKDAVDDSARAGIRLLLEQIGMEIAPILRKAIERPKQRPLFYRDLLLALGHMRDPDSYQLANVFLGDEEWEVRQAAFKALAYIGGDKSEAALLRGLKDPELTIRKTAVFLLGEIGSRTKQFTAFLIQLVSGKMHPGLSKEISAVFNREWNALRLVTLQLMNTGFAALHSLLEKGIFTRVDFKREDFEDYLIKSMKKQMNISFFKGSEEVMRERLRVYARIISILHLMGTENSLPLLRNARNLSDADIQHQAARAIREIKEREQIVYREHWSNRALRFLKSLLGFS